MTIKPDEYFIQKAYGDLFQKMPITYEAYCFKLCEAMARLNARFWNVAAEKMLRDLVIYKMKDPDFDPIVLNTGEYKIFEDVCRSEFIDT